MADLKEPQQRSIGAFSADDAKALADHPDIVSTVPSPTGRTELRGREATKEYNQSWFSAFPDARTTILNEVIVGDYIVQEGTFEGTNTGTWKSVAGDMPATGNRVKGQYCQVAKVRDGLIVSSNLYFDQIELLTQLGLMPAPAKARV